MRGGRKVGFSLEKGRAAAEALQRDARMSEAATLFWRWIAVMIENSIAPSPA